MSDECKQCRELELRLLTIEQDIASKMGPRSRSRADNKPHLLLGELLTLLSEIDRSYRVHKRSHKSPTEELRTSALPLSKKVVG